MPKPVDRGRVAAQGSERPPEQALVELGGAAVWIAVNSVGIASVQILRCKHVDHTDFAPQIGRVSSDPVQDTVGISFSECCGPTVGGVEFPG
jgi:hypothetical protein